MSTSSTDSVFSLNTFRVAIPPGATQAVYINLAQTAGSNALVMKYFSGSSIEIINPASGGSTQSAAALVTLSGTGYLIGTNETLNIDGAPCFYAQATGATGVLMFVGGLSQGN